MALSPSENVAMDVIFSTPGPTCLVSRVEEDAVVVLGMATVQILRCQALGGKGEEDDSGEVETHDSHVLLIVLPDMSPLVVGLVSSTTILRIADKQYMAPGTRPGTFLGLSIGEGEDREGDAESLRAAFEEAIEAIATLVIEVPTTDQDTDRTVSVLRTMSKGVQSGSQTAGATVVASAEVIARKLRAGGRRLQRRIVPVEEGQGTKVSQSTRHKVQSAKVLTGAASTISRSLVSGAMSTAASLGKSLSAALKETPAAKRMAVSGGERGAAAGELVVSTLVATGTIIQSFLEAGQILLASTAASTAELVEHKYGEEAGELARDVAAVTVNVGSTMRDTSRLGVGGLARLTAKETGKSLAGIGDEADYEQQRAGAADPRMSALGSMVLGASVAAQSATDEAKKAGGSA